MLADAFTNMDGLLVAALGPKMNAKFDADDFSPDSGTLDARIDTTNGFLEAFVKGKDQTLRSNKNKPINAELKITEPLRKRLLEKVHPVLADIRTTKQPLKVNITKSVIPTDGDMSKLDADLEITIGEAHPRLVEIERQVREVERIDDAIPVRVGHQREERRLVGAGDSIAADIRNVAGADGDAIVPVGNRHGQVELCRVRVGIVVD